MESPEHPKLNAELWTMEDRKIPQRGALEQIIKVGTNFQRELTLSIESNFRLAAKRGKQETYGRHVACDTPTIRLLGDGFPHRMRGRLRMVGKELQTRHPDWGGPGWSDPQG